MRALTQFAVPILLTGKLNWLGWYWFHDKKKWERDDTPAKEATKLIKVRIWAANDKVEPAAELFTERAEEMGLRLIEKSEPYLCRPPQQGESSNYLTFEDVED